MRKSVAKKIRSIVKPVDSITRRVYRRLKKSYVSLSKEEKKRFFESAGKIFSSKSE